MKAACIEQHVDAEDEIMHEAASRVESEVKFSSGAAPSAACRD